MLIVKDFEGFDEELLSAVLQVFANKIAQGKRGATVEASGGGEFYVGRRGDKIKIIYTKRAQIFRALSLAVQHSGDFEARGAHCDSLTFMLDCSRGGVINIDAFGRLASVLAQFGYDSIQLYTEDTYAIEGEPYFGHLRGRLTKDEIKAMDSFAARLGIELVPCIQTLAHLENIFLWPRFQKIRDITDILLLDDAETDELIDKMFATAAECFRSRRINIGFDEAHLVGLGKYFERHGHVDRVDLVMRHLKKVLASARRHGFAAMMWSDMFFRLNYGDYYPPLGAPPLESKVVALAPKDVELVYWDYYKSEEQYYEDMLRLHSAFDNKIIFASGAWRWLGFAPLNRFGLNRIKPAMSVIKRRGIKEAILTAWGDDGNESCLFSVLPQIAAFAELAYGDNADDAVLDGRLRAITDIPLSAFMALDLPNSFNNSDWSKDVNPAKYLVYNDPLLGLFDYHVESGYGDFCARCADILTGAGKNTGDYRYMFDKAVALCGFLAVKANLGNELRTAYAANDKNALRRYAANIIPTAIARLDAFVAALRKGWYVENKTYGFNVLQLRLGGLRLRLEETALRLTEYCDGKIPAIDELTQPPLPYGSDEKTSIYKHNYRAMCAPNFTIN